ncbi:MAG TPA: trypsin-like peptidase domain-containing protein [Kofleriaceae bacterium]|nr:trypsin-like peptidase domain-containing protein [Kofleriaceae bacterium]
MKAHRLLIAAFAAVGLVGAGAALHGGSGSAVAGPPGGIPTDGTIADVAERVVDSVVTISVSRQASPDDWDPFASFGQEQAVRAEGSGVIVTASGRILTNAHVVNGFDNIKVTLPDGSVHDAKVIGKDTKADLAVIQLKGSVPALKPIAFGDSNTLRLGDIVLAIGDGLGVGKSVSMGIVSAKGRGDMGIEEYEDFIQTDASINPGNSGGALVNLRGELVGINTAIASRSGGSVGIGFAIPSAMARPIMEMLVRDGKVTRGYLGVNIVTVTPDLAQQHKLGAQSGVVVAGLQADGPAAKAHLAQGDVIVGMNGTAVKSSGVLRNEIAMIRPGTVVSFEVVHRNGSHATVPAKLGEMPDQQPVVQQQMQQQMPRGFHPRGFQMPHGMQMPSGPGWQCQQTQNGWECHSGGTGGNGGGNPAPAPSGGGGDDDGW